MTSFRLVLAIAAGCILLRPASLPADNIAPAAAPAAAPSTVPPVALEKHYSADLTVNTSKGMVIQSKTFIDGDKMRSDVTMNGMAMSIIVRKDTKKIYQILEAAKMIMQSDFDPTKSSGMKAAAAFGPEGKFELIGPDPVDGVTCTKYKVTSDTSKQVFFFWSDDVKKVPVQMVAADGSLVVKWKNYVAGPQDASLFEPPAGYQTMVMPEGPDFQGGM